MKKNNLSKILSTSLSLALVATSAPMPVGAIGPVDAAAPAFVAQLTPPERFGYVSSSFAPHDAARPRMIVISDLHGHVEVQHNIVGILEHLVSQLHQDGKQIPIFVEGGWEPHLEEPLKTVTNPDVRSFMSEYYLQKAEINASQAFSEKIVGQGQVELIGVESKDEYLANKAQYVKTYPVRKELLLALQGEEASVRMVSKVLTGSSYKHLQQMRDDYMAGRIQPESFARTLVQLARHNGISNHMVTTLQNVSTASQTDLDVAFAEVYRMVIQSLASKKPLSALLRKSLGDEATIRENLAKIDASLDLLKRLVGNQLTPSEVPLAVLRMPELIETAEMLLAKSPEKDKAAQVIRESLDFYPYAMIRDNTLSENSLKALNAFGPDATGILITGGFHTDAIADRLRSQQIPYMVIHPTITRDLTAEEQLNYVKRVGDEHVTPVEIGQDIETLRQRRPIHTQASANGVVSDLDAERGGNESKMLDGYANVVAARMSLAADAKVLAPLMAEAQQNVAEAAELPSMKEAQAQVAGSQTLGALSDSIDWESGISVNRNLSDNQYEGTANGISASHAQTLAGIINDVVGAVDPNLERAKDIERIHIVGIDDETAVTKMGAEAKIMWNPGDKSRTIVMANSKLNTVKFLLDRLDKVKGTDQEAAIQRSLHTLVHELVHAFDENGASETSTILKGVAVTAAIVAARSGGERTVIEANILNLVNAIMPQFENSKSPLSAAIVQIPNLAEIIARAIDPEASLGENAQKVFDAMVDELQAQHLNRTPYEVKAAIEKEMSSARGRFEFAMAEGIGDNGGKLPPKVEKEAGDALNKIDADAGRAGEQEAG